MKLIENKNIKHRIDRKTKTKNINLIENENRKHKINRKHKMYGKTNYGLSF